jgi:hypothetical protein
VVFQAQAFSINLQADNFLAGLVRTGNASLPPGFFVLGSQLRFCDHVPTSFSTESCQVVWDGGGTGNATSSSGGSGNSSVSSSARMNTTSPSPTSVAHITPTATMHAEIFVAHSIAEDLDALSLFDKRRSLPHPQVEIVEIDRTSSGGRTAVRLEGFENNGEDVILDNKCLVALNWPVQT